MKYLTLILSIFILGSCTSPIQENAISLPTDGPIQLHPENPHYFLYQGKALALITSAEHYGAVLNLDFDYKTYLQTLANEGMNYTRIFTGSYFEIPGESFNIQKNTLAPQPDKVITPWKVVESTAAPQYDLTAWNEAYFNRLKDFMATAAENDIIVEVTLFSSIYRDEHWDISPQNPANNVNLTEEISRKDAQTPNNGGLLELQKLFVGKMVQELNEYDNFFFEIQNEPWSDHAVPVYNIVNKEDLKVGDWTYKADFADEAAMAWQEQLAATIETAERELPKQHLIAQNYVNFRAPIPVVSDRISIINFHYAWPEAVEWNYHYNRVLGFDESGFAGSDDQVYRRQAWQFMLSGGGLFNNLDYTFFPGAEDGSGENNAPGGGGKSLRQQLQVLSEFVHGFSLEKLSPNSHCVISSPGLIPYVLSDGDTTFAIYIRAIGTQSSQLHLATAPGTYEVWTLNPLTGSRSTPSILSAKEGTLILDLDLPEGELALKITRQ